MNKKELKTKNRQEQKRWRKMSLQEIIVELGKHHKHKKKRPGKRGFRIGGGYSSVDIEGSVKGSGRVIYTPMGNKR